jgi:hypothetical protein
VSADPVIALARRHAIASAGFWRDDTDDETMSSFRDLMSRIEQALADTPSHSLAGVLAKLRIAATTWDQEDTMAERVGFSALADLERLATS